MAINIAKAVAKGFSGANGTTLGFKSSVLTKYTPGIRRPGNLSGGTNPTTQDFKCSAIEVTAFQSQLPDSLVQDSAAQVMILGATIEGGAAPAPTDRITIGNKTYVIIDKGNAVVRDPVGATYICACQ